MIESDPSWATLARVVAQVERTWSRGAAAAPEARLAAGGGPAPPAAGAPDLHRQSAAAEVGWGDRARHLHISAEATANAAFAATQQRGHSRYVRGPIRRVGARRCGAVAGAAVGGARAAPELLTSPWKGKSHG